MGGSSRASDWWGLRAGERSSSIRRLRVTIGLDLLSSHDETSFIDITGAHTLCYAPVECGIGCLHDTNGPLSLAIEGCIGTAILLHAIAPQRLLDLIAKRIKNVCMRSGATLLLLTNNTRADARHVVQ